MAANSLPDHMSQTLVSIVARALEEDIGSGDITAQLIPASQHASAYVMTREPAIFCGQIWATEVFQQIDSTVVLHWLVSDGDRIEANQRLLELTGPTRSLLTSERTALNFLQCLSGTATTCQQYARLAANTGVKLLDTRKTIPGLRGAQKYAVTCGGCYNHRFGLFDAFLIKENHITACGGITNAVTVARQQAPNKPITVEVEDLAELEEALKAGVDTIMLDNFSLDHLKQAVAIRRAIGDSAAILEASGGIDEHSIRAVAETGVDAISIGSLTKHCQAIDLSMQVTVHQ